ATLVALISPQTWAAESMGSARAFEDSSVVIDDIQYVGNSILSEADLDKVLEIGPGDLLDRKKVLDTSKNIQDLYRSRGYDEVGIQIQLSRKPIPKTKSFDQILEIKIKEGFPIRVSEVKFAWPDGKRLGRLRSFESRFGFTPGDPLDEEKLTKGFRAIQDGLAAQDYMGAKVELKSVQITAPPSADQVSPEILESVSKWVEITVAIDMGERVTFGFQGNKVLSHQDIATLVEEQRQVGLAADYISRIQARVVEDYRKLGYDQVKIETFTFESPVEQKRHVSFKIIEGPRVQIESVRFDGHLFYSAEDLEKLFWENAVNPVSRKYYVETEVAKTAELVIEKLKANGYLSAKLISVAKTARDDGQKVELVITLSEGEQTLTERIDFPGLSVFTEAEVRQTLGTQTETPLNLFAFNEGLERLKIMYRAKGYYDLKITNEGSNSVITYIQENRRARVRLDFSEGSPSYVSHIQIEGNRKTQVEVIAREVQLKEGDLLEEPKWLETEARIRRLGLFATVNVQALPETDQPNQKILRIKVEEGSPGVLAGGLGLRNDLGARAFGQISYGNLWGRNHTASLTANANRRFGGLGSSFCASAKQKLADPNKDFCFIEFDLSLAYAYPYVFWGNTVFRPSLTGERKQLQTRMGETFDVDSIALALT
ncbi:MAG: outer membrane protein assembly factor, partial [Proteobacteria bacterium]